MGYKDKSAFKYINFGISFGLTMGITVYLLYLGGKWLDSRLGTTPLFIMLGILLAIATVFRQLIGDIETLNDEITKAKSKDEDENN